MFSSTTRLASLTSLVDEIRADGERWRWHMTDISRLGITAAPVFTTLMDIHANGMRFRPDPANPDRAAATGEIRVEPIDDGRTEVLLDLTASVELPLPRMARRAVEGVMDATLRLGGRRFADNLLAELGGPEDEGLVVRAAPVTAG